MANPTWQLQPRWSSDCYIASITIMFCAFGFSEASADRYYMALYSKLNDEEITSSAKLPMFLNLLLKSMKRDSVEVRVQVKMHAEVS